MEVLVCVYDDFWGAYGRIGEREVEAVQKYKGNSFYLFG